MATKRPKDDVPIPSAKEREADPDFVDRVFDYVVELLPEIKGKRQEITEALRDEFGGAQLYIRKAPAQDDTVARVLRMFNGRNASEVARKLGISRASVYRYMKQPGK